MGEFHDATSRAVQIIKLPVNHSPQMQETGKLGKFYNTVTCGTD